MNGTADIKSTIVSQMTQIATEQQRELAPLNDDLMLAHSGLDSLGLAILVARLEDKLGFDPFTESQSVYFPVTFGDFVRFYENARK
jgi:acyl carrier protein